MNPDYKVNVKNTNDEIASGYPRIALQKFQR